MDKRRTREAFLLPRQQVIPFPPPLRLQVLPDMILPTGGTRRAATLAEDLIAIDCQDVYLPTASGPSTTTCITAPSSGVNLYTHVCYICNVLQSARSHTSRTATTNVIWIFISPAEHCRPRNHRHISQLFHHTRNSPSPLDSQPSLKSHSDLGRTHPCEDVYANYVLMAKF